MVDDEVMDNVLVEGHLAETECTRIGRRVGAQIRREMGLPKYTTANLAVAMQRVESYRRQEIEQHNFRPIYGEAFTNHALYWVFSPSVGEVRMMNALHTAADRNRRLSVEGRYDFEASFLYRLIPVCFRFKWVLRSLAATGRIPWVGPGFQ